jgi:hypothetical protein
VNCGFFVKKSCVKESLQKPFNHKYGVILVEECIVNNKTLSSAFLTAIIISGLILVSTAHFGAVHASTEVTGIISSDTTWTKANSPYNLTGNVLIDAGVTVTVEADAVVNLNGYYIRVNGTLIIQPAATLNMGVTGNVSYIQVNGVLSARGTSASPIHFNGAAHY